jgi:tetratricopeptide (TPR) repeat protein
MGEGQPDVATDDELCRAALAGEEDAFRELVLRYQDGICGWAAQFLGEHRAEAELDDYATRGPRDGGAGYYYYGTVLEKEGKSEKAQWAYRQALGTAGGVAPWVERLARSRLGDKAPRSLRDIAQDLFEIGEHALALEAFEKVAQRIPGTKDGAYARMMVALCYEELKQDDKAEQAFRAYTKEYAPSGAGLFYFGQFLNGHGKPVEAREVFAKAATAADTPDWARKEDLLVSPLEKVPAGVRASRRLRSFDRRLTRRWQNIIERDVYAMETRQE